MLALARVAKPLGGFASHSRTKSGSVGLVEYVGPPSPPVGPKLIQPKLCAAAVPCPFQADSGRAAKQMPKKTDATSRAGRLSAPNFRGAPRTSFPPTLFSRFVSRAA